MNDQSDETRALIARRLREARKMAGLSQLHVANMLGLHRPAISEIESGGRRVSADELARLADIYDVSASWIVGDAPETLATDDPRLQLAARELGKLKPEDLERVLKLFAAMRGSDGQEPGDGS